MGRRKAAVERDPLSLDAARARVLGFESYGKYMPHKERLSREGKLPGPEEIPDLNPPRSGCGPVTVIRGGVTGEAADGSTAGWKCNPNLNWDREAGYRMWLEGKGDTQIARALGVCSQTVKRHRKEKWIPRANREGREKPVTVRAAGGWDTEKGYRLWLEGVPQKEIARTLGVSALTVSVCKNRNWVPRAEAEGLSPERRSGGQPTWDTEKGYQLWLKGVSHERIGKALGVSRSTVGAQCRGAWIPRAKAEGKLRTVAQRRTSRGKVASWDTGEGYRKFQAGISLQQIAREAGVSYAAVFNYCTRHWRKEEDEV